jgi:hypothetical protein
MKKLVIKRPLAKRDIEERRIMKKYWFFHPEKSVKEGLMAFGFECDIGWFPIIEKLCEDINNVIDKEFPLMKSGKFPFEVSQVKEKYGGLRFYTNTSVDEIDDLIHEAEMVCERTCEICGGSGETMTKGGNPDGWIKTLCKRHAKELKYA